MDVSFNFDPQNTCTKTVCKAFVCDTACFKAPLIAAFSIKLSATSIEDESDAPKLL